MLSAVLRTLRLPAAPTQLVLAFVSWVSAAVFLRRTRWRFPVCGGALVALGMQEVAETLAVVGPDVLALAASLGPDAPAQ